MPTVSARTSGKIYVWDCGLPRPQTPLRQSRCRGAGAYDGRSQSSWAAWFSPAKGDPCGANKNTWRELYYDDAASLGLKYDLVNGRGLRGAGIWALGYDGASRDLWNVLAARFR